MSLFFALLAFVLGVALYSNTQRKKRSLKYELTPNCLLTRWPILFISGKRSLFYFTNYWNVFPEFLSEHGYEVYSLNLPWVGSTRAKKITEFLTVHSEKGRHYHLVTDPMTYLEFTDTWSQKHSCVASLTKIQSAMELSSSLGIWNSLSYGMHRLRMWPNKCPSPHSLGVSAVASLQNAQLLLQKVSQLAEQDIQEI